MVTTVFPKKFLSRRERNGHRRDRSSDGTQKHRPISSDTFFSLFKFDGTRQHNKEEDEVTRQEREAAKVEEVRQKLPRISAEFGDLQDEHIRYALNMKYASMDVDKAIEILVLQQASVAGEIVPYNPAVNMLGAENRGNVTCYLDALLFAMFAKLDAFECMLKVDMEDGPRKRLAVLLRLWVNMLRTGKLIETHMTQHIQDALAECGWQEAQLIEQQDTSEAFAFITETLQLPLLTLQVDLFHHGKNDDADHKVVYERLLNLAVPPDSEGKGVKLEDCLEEYFNSQVDVLREGSDEKKAIDRSDSSYTPNTADGSDLQNSTIRVVEVEDSQASTPENIHKHPYPELSNPSGHKSTLRPRRNRTDSIIQSVVIDKSELPSDEDPAGLFQRAKKKASVVKAVTIPAWQFFKLIPWHSSTPSEPQSDLEVARHFSQRPVVGICLKRYMVDQHGNMKRKNTYIDIPDSLRLPRFIVDERHMDEDGLTAEYKLVLQSVVCHRGDSLHSGHYVSFCRVAPKLMTDNRRHETDPPPDYEEAQWVKFDDLAIERVVTIDDIKESLKDEMPYLLFYQIVPIVGVAASSVGSLEAGPPAYHDETPIVITSGTPVRDMSRTNSSYFDAVSSNGDPSATPSVRFSVDVDPSGRRSFVDEDDHLNISRRASIAYGDLISPGLGTTSADHSPAASPGEETATHRLNRAAARFKPGGKSRPQSQAGETRISQTMSRFGLLKASKEPLRDFGFEVQGEDNNGFVVNGITSGHDEKEGSSHHNSKGKDKDSTQKRGKSKTRFGKGKARDDDNGNVPDRECVVS